MQWFLKYFPTKAAINPSDRPFGTMSVMHWCLSIGSLAQHYIPIIYHNIGYCTGVCLEIGHPQITGESKNVPCQTAEIHVQTHPFSVVELA